MKPEVSPFEYFDSVVDRCSEALIGLEYVLLFSNPRRMIKPFHCALCDKAYDEHLIRCHLVSNFHRQNYLILNFPTLLKYLQSKKRFTADFNERELILSRISENLQTFVARLKPKVVNFDDFKINPKKHVEALLKVETFGEKTLINFMEISLKNVSGLDDDFPPPDGESGDSGDFLDFPSDGYNNNKIEAYNKEVAALEAQIESSYKLFQELPSSHPKFAKTWENFRKNRGQLEKTADVAACWQKFWLLRLEEFKQTEIYEGKREIRDRLDLSASDLLDYQRELQAKIFRPFEAENHQFKDDGESDSDYGKDFRESCIRMPCYKMRPRKRRCLVTELHHKSNDELMRPENFKFDMPGTVFSVCRHLIALHSELGHVVNAIRRFYLPSAAMEMSAPFSSERIVCERENFVTFSVLVLRLREALEDDAFPSWKLRGARRVLQQLNAMLMQAAFRHKDLDDEYRRRLAKIQPPFGENRGEKGEEDEVEGIVRRIFGEQGTRCSDEELEVIVEAIRLELANEC